MLCDLLSILCETDIWYAVRKWQDVTRTDVHRVSGSFSLCCFLITRFFPSLNSLLTGFDCSKLPHTLQSHPSDTFLIPSSPFSPPFLSSSVFSVKNTEGQRLCICTSKKKKRSDWGEMSFPSHHQRNNTIWWRENSIIIHMSTWDMRKLNGTLLLLFTCY